MKIKDILNETLTDIVFHTTNIKSAISILKNGRFNLSSTFEYSKEKELTGKMFYLSVARTKTNDYRMEGFSDGYIVTFVLNGRWFNQRNKSKAVDYFEKDREEYRKYGKEMASETEDRIISDKGFIDFKGKENKAIREIHVFYYDDNRDEIRLILEAKKKNIPIYFYDNKQNYIVMNKSKSLNLKDIYKDKKFTHNYDSDLDDTHKEISFKDFADIFDKHDKKELSKTTKLIMNQQVDMISKLDDIYKNDPEKYNKVLRKFKKHGITTLRELMKFIENKWFKRDR